MTDTDWRDRYAPTHRCIGCNALWRLLRNEDFPGQPPNYDSWSLISNECWPCCDNVEMADQIVPMKMGDIEKYLVALVSVDAALQHVLGAKDGDSVN